MKNGNWKIIMHLFKTKFSKYAYVHFEYRWVDLLFSDRFEIKVYIIYEFWR